MLPVWHKKEVQMSQIFQFFSTVPLWGFITAGVIFLGLLVGLFFITRKKKIFYRLLAEAVNTRNSETLLEKYSYEYLCRKSREIEEVSRKKEFNLPELLQLGDFWLEKFNRTGKLSILDSILEFIPDKGLFSVFIKALDNDKVASRLQDYIDNAKDLLILRRIALSGKGQFFDGNKAMILFQNRMDEIREMMGDPEWAARYMAVKILLHDGEERSDRAVWDSFDDPHSLVRATVAQEIDKEAKPYDSQEQSQSGSFLFDKLKDLLLNDPVLEVRKAAKDRIMKEFHQFYSWQGQTLATEQSLHILQLLDTQSQEDQDFAMKCLDGENLEMRLSAARFLQDCGTLTRLFKESYLNDMEGLERNFSLLEKSFQVNVTGFLKELEKQDNPGSLLLASRVLKASPHRNSIKSLAGKVFKLSEETKIDSEYRELYTNTLDCISRSGCDESLRLMKREIVQVNQNELLLKDLLARIPQRSSHIFINLLVEYLKDPDFSLKDDLRKALRQMPEPEVLETVLDIIHAGRSVYSHPVRIQALKVLVEMQKEYCLQIILENLSILPLEEGKEFAKLLSSFDEKLFDERVGSILNSVDAQSRASIIVCLPATGKKTFIKQIQDGLNDANPEVRVACIWALIDYGETKHLNKSVEMLRDPVESVRMEVARALGEFGTDSVLCEMESVINDENEVESVKTAAIQGLSRSDSAKAVDILVRKIEKDKELKFECMESLSMMRKKKSLTALVEQFKDGSPQLRDDISQAVQMMGPEGEALMVNLLKEDIPSLHHYIAEVLESSGHVEANIRLLKHRDPKVRKEAADFLSAVRTRAAFRGIVLAARDPDTEVRVSVTKALEALSTDEGKEILKELEQDPDKKVRKYTLWALERIKTKGL